LTRHAVGPCTAGARSLLQSSCRLASRPDGPGYVSYELCVDHAVTCFLGRGLLFVKSRCGSLMYLDMCLGVGPSGRRQIKYLSMTDFPAPKRLKGRQDPSIAPPPTLPPLSPPLLPPTGSSCPQFKAPGSAQIRHRPANIGPGAAKSTPRTSGAGRGTAQQLPREARARHERPGPAQEREPRRADPEWPRTTRSRPGKAQERPIGVQRAARSPDLSGHQDAARGQDWTPGATQGGPTYAQKIVRTH